MANKSEIAQILALFYGLPNCPVNSATLPSLTEAYHLVLADFDFTHLKVAAAQYLSTGTFFPTPGNLRETALDIMLSASGIPTAAEAWADVLHAKDSVPTHRCETGIRLTEAIDNEHYWSALAELGKHLDACTECHPPMTIEKYSHPVVEQAVKRLGGWDALMTDNPAADRARFIDAYREIVALERKDAGRIPEVTKFIDTRRAELAAGRVKQLTERMSK